MEMSFEVMYLALMIKMVIKHLRHTCKMEMFGDKNVWLFRLAERPNPCKQVAHGCKE